jgi:hypothetical protein
MKRIPSFFGMALCVAVPSLAQPANATVGELLAALRVQPANEKNWIVIPITGTGFGQTGAVFHTELALTGSHDFYYDLRVAVAWLPLGRDASANPVQYMVLPGEFDNGFTLQHDGFGNGGFGALVIAAVDSGGALDPAGKVSVDVRIWSSSSCSGETSLGYRPTRWLGADRGTVIGLTLGDGFRANAGIVNADAAAHTWRIQYASIDDGSSFDFEVIVPAASSAIVGLPPDLSGPISVTIAPEATGLPWTGWGASVDNASGDAWYSSLIPF